MAAPGLPVGGGCLVDFTISPLQEADRPAAHAAGAAGLPATPRPRLGRQGGVRIMASFAGIVSGYEELPRKSRRRFAGAKQFLPRGGSSNCRVADPNPISIGPSLLP